MSLPYNLLSEALLPTTTAVLAMAFAYGTAFGSFIFLFICRAKVIYHNSDAYGNKGLFYAISVPQSRCGSCEARIPWYDNLPVLSWLVLLGRCRHCKNAINFKYPLSELACGAITAGTIYFFGLTGIALIAIFFLLFMIAVIGALAGIGDTNS